MQEQYIRRYIQPILFLIPTITGITIASILAHYDLFNPPTVLSIGYWCLAIPYPAQCQEVQVQVHAPLAVNVTNPDEAENGYGEHSGEIEEEQEQEQERQQSSTSKECVFIRGNLEVLNMLKMAMTGIIAIGLLIMVISLSLVIRRMIHTDRILRGGSKRRRGDDQRQHGNARRGGGREEHRNKIKSRNGGMRRRGNADRRISRHSTHTDNGNNNDNGNGNDDNNVNDTHSTSPRSGNTSVNANISIPDHGGGTTHSRGRGDLGTSTTLRHNRYNHTVSQSALQRAQTDSKVIILQSIAYVSAYTLGVVWVMTLDSETQSVSRSWYHFGLFFNPIQGFFNLCIFTSHKVYNYKRIHTTMGTWEVIRLLFCTSLQEPCFVSRVEIVAEGQLEHELNNMAFHLYNDPSPSQAGRERVEDGTVQIRDEMGNEEVIRFNGDDDDDGEEEEEDVELDDDDDDDMSSIVGDNDEEQKDQKKENDNEIHLNHEEVHQVVGVPNNTTTASVTVTARSVKFTEDNLPEGDFYSSPSRSVREEDFIDDDYSGVGVRGGGGVIGDDSDNDGADGAMLSRRSSFLSGFSSLLSWTRSDGDSM